MELIMCTSTIFDDIPLMEELNKPVRTVAKDPKRKWVIAAAVISALYMLNPGFGLFDLIPDNLPIIGNLDEGMAAYVIISAIAYLRGVDFGMFSGSEKVRHIDSDR